MEKYTQKQLRHLVNSGVAKDVTNARDRKKFRSLWLQRDAFKRRERPIIRRYSSHKCNLSILRIGELCGSLIH